MHTLMAIDSSMKDLQSLHTILDISEEFETKPRKIRSMFDKEPLSSIPIPLQTAYR